MRKKLLLVLTFVFCEMTQAQALQFSYDGAGNQIRRELVTVTVNALSDNDETASENQDPPSLNSIDVRAGIIEAYPNPVVDLLNIEWFTELKITEIALFDNAGKMLQFKKLEYESSRMVFDMSSYVAGIYYIRLFDVKRQNKTIKIIKK